MQFLKIISGFQVLRAQVRHCKMSEAMKMTADTSRKYEFKVVLVGDIGVGKTSIFKRFRENTFHERLNSTLGIDYFRKDIQTSGEVVRISLWDTAGMERAGSLTSNHYKGAHAILLVYAVDDVASIERLEKWIENANRYTKDAERCLVGNKYDLDKYEREVKDANIQGTIEKVKIKKDLVFQVSAKTGDGFDNMFATIATFLRASGRPNSHVKEEPFIIGGTDDTDNPSKGCC